MALKSDFLEQLGLLVINFENFQKILEYFIWVLIGDDQVVGQIITSKLSFKSICELASNLLHHKYEGVLVSEFDLLIKKAYQMEERRNSFVHSAYAWNTDPNAGIVRIKLSAKKGSKLQQTFEDVDANTVFDINEEFVSLFNDLGNFVNKCADIGIVKLNDWQLSIAKEFIREKRT